MTKEELAILLHGNEYREEISDSLNQKAKEAGLLVIYGASDDLGYLGGMGDQEFGCYGGGELVLRINEDREVEGHMYDELDDLEGDEIDAHLGFLTNYKNGNIVEVQWCEVEEYGWTYASKLPYETFDIMEDGVPYCRGIVIDVKDFK